MVSRPEDSGIILGNPDDDRAASLLGGGDMLYKSPKGVMRLQGLYLGTKAAFQEYLNQGMSTVSDTPFWDSKLNFSSFNIGFKGETSSNNQTLRTKLNKLTTDSLVNNNQSEEFSFNIILDDFTKAQIYSLHSRGYELHQIVQEVFNLSRADGRKYKRIRDVVAEFIASLEEEDNNDT
jgi:DNA segregation ATPase FtsK/SpoIIIE, S-DNA-T family